MNGSYKNESMFITLLAVLFIGLKLTHFITWSWWWVLSPIWIPCVLFLGGGVLIVLGYFLFKTRKKNEYE